METILNSNNNLIDKEVSEKLSKEVSSYIIEQIKNHIDNDIEKRAKQAGIISQIKSDYHYDKESVEFGYRAGAYKQKEIDKEEIKQLRSITEHTASVLGIGTKWLNEDARLKAIAKLKEMILNYFKEY